MDEDLQVTEVGNIKRWLTTMATLPHIQKRQFFLNTCHRQVEAADVFFPPTAYSF